MREVWLWREFGSFPILFPRVGLSRLGLWEKAGNALAGVRMGPLQQPPPKPSTFYSKSLPSFFFLSLSHLFPPFSFFLPFLSSLLFHPYDAIFLILRFLLFIFNFPLFLLFLRLFFSSRRELHFLFLVFFFYLFCEKNFCLLSHLSLFFFILSFIPLINDVFKLALLNYFVPIIISIEWEREREKKKVRRIC